MKQDFVPCSDRIYYENECSESDKDNMDGQVITMNNNNDKHANKYAYPAHPSNRHVPAHSGNHHAPSQFSNHAPSQSGKHRRITPISAFHTHLLADCKCSNCTNVMKDQKTERDWQHQDGKPRERNQNTERGWQHQDGKPRERKKFSVRSEFTHSYVKIIPFKAA